MRGAEIVKFGKIVFLTIAITGFVFLLSVPVFAQIQTGNSIGPAQKATGFISIYEPWDGGHREVDFNAHEAMMDRSAKGEMADYVYGPDGNLRRVFEYRIFYVRVDGDYGHFGAKCNYDSVGNLEGNWLYVKVYDGANPGSSGDYIGWKWGSETQVMSWVENGSTTGWWRKAIDGNLVVHTY